VDSGSDSSDAEQDTAGSTDENTSDCEMTNTPDEITSTNVGPDVPVLADTEDSELPQDDNVEDAAPKGKCLTAVCRMVLWMANTPGCLRECMMRYLDEAHFDDNNYAFPTPRDRPCCDRHTPTDSVDQALEKLLPDYVFRPRDNASQSLSSDSEWEREERLPQPSHEQITAIHEQLRLLRRRIWVELGLVTMFSPYPSYQLLSDEAIRRLGKRSASILSGSLKLQTILEIDTDIIAPDPLVHYFDDIQQAIQTGWDAAPPVPQKRRGRPPRANAEFVPPFDINPHADRATPEVQQALSQIEEAREAHSKAGQAEGLKQTITYADESSLHPNVKRMIGKRPQGRPSKAKVEQRNRQIADAMEHLGL
jgi:hypothetical protein